ncbi:hypothetical protein QUF76_19180, partial [Desulfobacterales bacterium HSG16]|nr:hypothetical protein [Desulfobacterales bacterium HSG16]
KEKSYIPFVFTPSQIETFLISIQQSIRKSYRDVFVTDVGVYTSIIIVVGRIIFSWLHTAHSTNKQLLI